MDLDQLYREYFTSVYRYIFSMCKDSLLAEEITQETFFRALKNLIHSAEKRVPGCGFVKLLRISISLISIRIIASVSLNSMNQITLWMKVLRALS